MKMKCKTGTIIRIKLENFVTYGDVVMYPGPSLNLIMGPNGTGKSTLLSALVIGLGGNLSVIGRATTLAAYVKQGQQKADIEIELADSPRNVVVKRTIAVTGSYQFEIDGKHKSIGDVRELCKKFNIQIDNLCQFLPQDRVQDFAKLNCQELLLSTERSVSDCDLLEMHTKLIKLRESYVKIKDDSEKLEAQLNSAKQLNARIQNIVTNIEKQNEIKESIKMYKIRLLWLIYEKHRAQFESVKKDQKLAQTEIKRISKEVEKSENEYKAAETQLSKKNEGVSKMRRLVQFEINKIKDLHESSEQFEETIKKKKEDFLKRKTLAETRDKEISHSMHLINSMNTQVKKSTPREKILEEINALNQESSIYNKKLDDLNSKRTTIVNELNDTVSAEIRYCKNKLAEIENVASRRLNVLRESNEDAYKATLWLRENENKFQDKIYPPILIELNVKNPEHSKFLENTISKRDLLAFTCENIEDMKLFVKTVKMEMKLKVSAVCSPPGYLKTYVPRLSIDNIKRYGFFSYMLQLIDGPEPVLSFLCKTYQVHNIPIGTAQTDKIADEVPSSIQLFYSDTFRYTTIISSYSGEKSVTTVPIGNRNLLNHNVDKTLEQKYKQKLQLLVRSSDDLRNNISMIETSMKELCVKRDQISEKRKGLQEQKQNLDIISNKIKIEEIKLKSLQSETFDMKIEQKELDDFLLQTLTKIKTLHKDVQKRINLLIQKNHEQANDNILVRQLKETMNMKQSIYLQAKDDLNSAEKTLHNIMKVYEHRKTEAKDKYNEAFIFSDNLAPDDENFPNKNKFNKMPTEIDVLEDMIEEQQSRADMLNVGDGNDYQDYHQRRELIGSTSETLERNTALIQDNIRQSNELGKVWKENITSLIEKIGTNFGRYMNHLQCAGDVTLISPADPDDYKEYGVSIKVRFRGAEVMQELNRYTQSGGERAVATAIYLLSLQELTTVPFRCVDEINQGMDPINERRVFELLTKVTNKQNVAQYFLLTPKLLPGLPYTPNIAVHCIYSGAMRIENKRICRNITD